MFALLACAAAFVVPPAPAAEPSKGGGSVQMLLAKIEGDKLTTTTTTPITRTVVATDKDGGTRTIQVKETTTTVTARDLKALRFSGPDGKEIPADDVKAKLRDGGPVVFLSGPLDADWRTKFKATAVFVEYIVPTEEEKKGEEKK
jgi:hypothetical protein